MSMISAQRDRLRAISQVLCAQGYVVEADEVRDAADMLWKLRCDLVDVNAKYDELRELAETLINCGRKYHTMGGSCPMFDADADAEDDDFCGAVQAARELGIEVV